jgi:tetratricopeptide (TPR) repeat protein
VALSVAPPPAAATPSPEAAAIREAYSLFQSGRIPEACDRYAEIAHRTGAPADRRSAGTCWGRLGRDAYQAGDAGRAQQHYQRGVEVSPEDRALWTGLVIASGRAGDLGRARMVAEDALRAFPDDAELGYLAAEVAERQGRTRDAVAILRRLLAAEPGYARARTRLASLEREERVEAGYWAQESQHFLVRYEGAQGIDLGRSVVDTLEDAYASIGRELGIYPTEKVQVGIYAAPVFGDVIGAPPHLIAGAYDGRKLRLNMAASRAYSQDLGRLVRHEYTHLLIHLASKGKAPTWLHEGLAQAMEPRSSPRFLEVSVPREALTLSGIERLSRTPDAAALAAGYSLTHVAVEFLLERGGVGAMRDLLGRIGNGVSIPEALRETYGFGPDEVEARLRGVAGRG